jgi:hypothetical protein
VATLSLVSSVSVSMQAHELVPGETGHELQAVVAPFTVELMVIVPLVAAEIAVKVTVEPSA